MAIISLKPTIITLAAGLGLLSLGVMLFLFLLKFIFSQSKEENPLRLEIKEKDQPQLFAFIQKLAEETNTQMPKKIFVSPELDFRPYRNGKR